MDTKYYRIDNRDFCCGDRVLPQNIYQEKLDDKRMLVEDILEQNRPASIPKRNEILMLFEDFNVARQHWIKQRNSKFYQTIVPQNRILYIGDYDKVEELFRNIENLKRANEIAKEYWNSEMTTISKVEVFVDSSIVEKIVSNSDEERQHTYSILLTGHSLFNGVKFIQQ